MSCQGLAAYRNSDLKVTYSFPSGYDLTGFAPAFYFRASPGAPPLLSVTAFPVGSGSVASVSGRTVVLTLKGVDVGGAFPDEEIWSGVFDSTLTKDGFVNRFAGGPLTTYADGSFNEDFSESIFVEISGQQVPVVVQGGNLGISASVMLAELDESVALAQAAAATAVAATASKLNISGDNTPDGGLLTRTNLGLRFNQVSSPRVRDLKDRMLDDIHVKDYYQATDPNMWDCVNRAIQYANASGGYKAVLVTPAEYDCSNRGAFDAITANGVEIYGFGEASRITLPIGSQGFRFGTDGGAQIAGGGIQNLSLVTSTVGNASTIAINISNAARLTFQDIHVERLTTICRVGTDQTKPVAQTKFDNIHGFVGNSGRPSFELVSGTGFTLSNSDLYVDGVVTPPNLTDPLAVLAGTYLISCDGNNWDTLQVPGGQLFQRFDKCLNVRTTAGKVFYCIEWGDNVCDIVNNANRLRAEGGGIISTVGISGYLNGWGDVGIRMETDEVSNPGSGSRVAFVKLNQPNVFLTKFQGIVHQDGVIEVDYVAPQVYANNTSSTAGIAAIDIADNVQAFTMTGGRPGAVRPTLGFGNQAAVGVRIGANCNGYSVTNVYAQGSVQGWDIKANTAAAVQRRVSGNANANYAGWKTAADNPIFATPASGVVWSNTTPHTVQVHFFGGTTVGYALNGIAQTGLTVGNLTVEPGQNFQVNYATPPTINWNVLP